MKIGVLGGGVSAERKISLISAKEVCKALIKKNLDVVFIDILTKEKDEVKKLIRGFTIDLAFIALHGEFGEDGGIQEILEELGIAYTGSEPWASALTMDKVLSKRIFKDKGIPTPNFITCLRKESIPDEVNYPLVVKPCSSGSSIGVSVVRERGDFKAALKLAFSYSDKIILEDYIEGRELTVGILDNRPLAIIEIIPKKEHFDFDAKYCEGMSDFIVPAFLNEKLERQIKAVGLAAHRVLGCRHFSRVDIRLDKNNFPFVLEVNSIPGLTLHSLFPLAAKAQGINFGDLIFKMVELGLYEKKEAQKV